MFLGIEIGGTKLQFGVGLGDGSELALLVRHEVDPINQAAGILSQIESTAKDLISRYEIEKIGIGFGGPVDVKTGTTILSHQIEGWESFPLAAWVRKTFNRLGIIGNDCDLAALAEARFGAGKGKERVFFVTVGTGVGGGWVRDGHLDGINSPAIAEIGHLRPGLQADSPEITVESMASGWGIAEVTRSYISTGLLDGSGKTCRGESIDLLQRCDGKLAQLSAEIVSQAAAEGNSIATRAIGRACGALGWAIAQMITITSPDVIVIGGGVSLMGKELFLNPVRDEVIRYVFPPLIGSYEIVPAGLGELVVVHGALAISSAANIETKGLPSE
jgi:glucokinase